MDLDIRSCSGKITTYAYYFYRLKPCLLRRQNHSNMKNFFSTIVIIAVLVGGFIYLKKGSSSETTAADDLAQRDTTAEVQTKDIEFVVTVAGEITPAEQVSVRPEVNGLISELPVDVGDQVKKNDLLFALDDKNIRIEIEQKQTQIDAAKLQLEKVRRIFENNPQVKAQCFNLKLYLGRSNLHLGHSFNTFCAPAAISSKGFVLWVLQLPF